MKASLLGLSMIAILALTGCTQKQAQVEPTVAPVTTAPMEQIQPISTTADKGTLTAADSALNKVEAVSSSASMNPSAESQAEKSLGSIYFDLNDYAVRDDMKSILDGNVKKVSTFKKVRLEGNCDERGSDEYNMALGLKRTQSVKEALMNGGIKSEIETVSLGESAPICKESAEACWSKNRRVDFKLPTK